MERGPDAFPLPADAVGEIVDPVPDLRVRIPSHLMRYVVEKGSITVDGISLTVFDVKDDCFSVAIIPYTFEHTTMSALLPGMEVDLEFDVLGKYVQRILQFR